MYISYNDTSTIDIWDDISRYDIYMADKPMSIYTILIAIYSIGYIIRGA